ncbi:LLM class flavin-dependent oxidoreductase [Zavarzinia compransoris]|uniref:LLM class flavin-dependent oxidoreductase n=1 Tax=Zavarzinia marina TaxID=2911065 RepID=UPI001F38BD78|nr:LLM class flavin-dependent oxidoreductase [Zavarzinia marina]MCF4167322.1 LLM class flavin-dependent oxidoreductase [Zavarzinia marina]
MAERGKMALALLAQAHGLHPAGWMKAPGATDGTNDIDYHVAMAQLAEKGKFDLFFIADTPAARTDNLDAWSRYIPYMNCLEPITLLTALAGHTSRIGLGGTASTSFYEPYNLARLYGSLDHISHGRAAWNVVTSGNNYAARNFGEDKLAPHARRYARAKEFVEIVKALWDTYDDDAVVFDKARGVYFDPAKFHVLDHQGEFFKMHSALNLARCPQGQPVIIQAGASDAGKELAAETAEVVFNSDDTPEAAKAYYDDVKGRMAKFGRTPDEIRVLAGLTPTIGESRWEAEDKHRTLQEMIHPLVGKIRVASDLEADVSDLDPDQPIPLDRIPKSANLHTRYFQQIVAMITEQKLTLRQLWQRYERGNKRVIGTPADVADAMEEWFSLGACDGYMVIFPTLPDGLEAFVAGVVPELQRRGLYKLDYEGTTLREHLGFRRPESRYARAGMKAAG